MPRVTIAMLERDIRMLHDMLRERNHKIELLEMQVRTLMSPHSAHGQVASAFICAERLGDALAHVLREPVLREFREARKEVYQTDALREKKSLW